MFDGYLIEKRAWAVLSEGSNKHTLFINFRNSVNLFELINQFYADMVKLREGNVQFNKSVTLTSKFNSVKSMKLIVEDIFEKLKAIRIYLKNKGSLIKEVDNSISYFKELTKNLTTRYNKISELVKHNDSLETNELNVVKKDVSLEKCLRRDILCKILQIQQKELKKAIKELENDEVTNENVINLINNRLQQLNKVPDSATNF